MTKKVFLDTLREKLYGLPKQDVEDRVAFYSEMIDDRMEEGRTEEQAVSDVGSVGKIASQIITNTPIAKIAYNEFLPKKRFKAWEIVLLVMGFPIWISLITSAFAVILSLYVTMWSVIISLWAVFVSLCVSALACAVMSVVFIASGNSTLGIVGLCAALICTGLTIFMYVGCKAATKGTLLLTKKIILGIKKRFSKKEEL